MTKEEEIMGKKRLRFYFLGILAAVLCCLPARAKAQEERGQIFYYNFSDSDSVVVKDASGNGNDAIIRNYRKSGFRIHTEVIQGTTVQALDLPGGRDGAYLELPDDILDGETQITVCAWVRVHSSDGYQRIWDFGNGQSDYLYLLTNGGNEGFKGYSTAITNQGWMAEEGVSKGSDFDRNTWIFTTVTIQEDKITLYQDGEIIGKTRATVTLSDLGGTRNNYFGKGQFGDPHMDGELAEICMYNYAMGEDEVLELYQGLKEDQILPESIQMNPDRLLYSYRINYGEDTKGARPLFGTENPNSLLKGTALGTYLSQLAASYQNNRDVRLREKMEYVVGELFKLQSKSKELGWGEGYLSPMKPKAFRTFEAGAGYPKAGNPYGGIGSLLHGLLDVVEKAGIQQAEQVALSLADWTVKRSSGYTKEKRELYWGQKTTGDTWALGGAMARLYGRTGERKYERAAHRFVSPKWYQAMREEKDGMNLLSVSSGISQAQTLLELYRADHTEVEAKKAAEFFWETATEKYTYVTGSPGVEGSFRSTAQAVEEAPVQDQESRRLCMKMLHLTWLLHEINPQETKYLDYYERVLRNQKLEDFWESVCATSRILEQRENELYLNFYLPAEEVHKKSGLQIQLAMEPYAENAEISVDDRGGAGPNASVDLYLRVPSWCKEGVQVQLNGEVVVPRQVNGYLWLSGIKASDKVSVSFPFSCYLEEREQGTSAVMFGPYVMVTEEPDSERTLVLTRRVTDMAARMASVLPALSINEKIFLPYGVSVSGHRKLYYQILYTADPGKPYYRIRVEEEEATGGSVKADHELVLEGDDVKITVKAKEGYELESLTVNGTEMEVKEEGSCWISDVREDLEIDGKFVLKNPLTPSSDSLEQAAVASAHYTAPWENLEGIQDSDFEPASSDEGMGKGWGNWQQQEGAECWLAYTWAKPVTLNTCDLYWYDDGGDTGIPESFFLEYLDEKNQWRKAVIKGDWREALKKNQYNRITLEPVTTTQLRLVMTVAQGKQAVGVYRWKVSEQR